jgi:hypothetical protein
VNEEEELDAAIQDLTEQEESAPPEEEAQEESAEEPENLEEEPEKKESKGFQKRINKRTADYYREKNRADELERKIAALEANKPVDVGAEPRLEDYDVSKFDYDEDLKHAAYQRDLSKFYAEQAVTKLQQQNKANQAKTQVDTALENYKAKVEQIGLDDFDEVVTPLYQNKILGDAAYTAILDQDNGPLIEYHLAKNLDLAAK